MQDQFKLFRDHYQSNLPHGDTRLAAADAANKGAVDSLFKHTLRTSKKSPNLKTHVIDRHTYIDLSCINMPFMVASLLNLLSARGIHIYSQQNFMMEVAFNKAGTKISKLIQEDRAVDKSQHKSADKSGDKIIVLRFIVEFLSMEERQELEQQIIILCQQVSKVTGDWQAIVKQVAKATGQYEDTYSPKPKTEDARKLKFLEWLMDNKCLLLGYGKYEQGGKGGKGEETARSTAANSLGLNSGSARVGDLNTVMHSIPVKQGIDFYKIPVMSPIHRQAYIHCISIGVETPAASGKNQKTHIEEHRFLLLYSFDFFSSSLREIPYIREGFQRQLDRLKIQPNTYKWRLLRYALSSYPRDEILQLIEDKAFNALTDRMMEAFSSTSFRNMVYYDKHNLFINNIILSPREDYNTDVRRGFEKLLQEKMQVTDGEFNVLFSEERLARVFLSFPLSAASPAKANIKQLEEDIAAVGVSWKYELRSALLEKFGDEQGIALYKQYDGIFGSSYCENFSGEQAAADLEHILAIGSDKYKVHLDLIPDKIGDYYKLRLIGVRAHASLSHLVHILEHAGAEPITSRPYFFAPSGDIKDEVRLIEFNLSIKDGGDMAAEDVKQQPTAKEFKAAFEETLAAVYSGATEDDEFNALAISNAMPARDIMLLRSWANYLSQVQTAFPYSYIQETLCAYPQCAAILVEMFKHKFDVQQGSAATSPAKMVRAMKGLSAKLDLLLEDVPLLDQEQILRNLRELINAVVRSNFHQLHIPDLNGKAAPVNLSGKDGGLAEQPDAAQYLTFKIHPDKLSCAEGKQPRTEIFVYSADFEGVHLRDGPLARGGIRWSDKRNGYRNEVYQLVKAQIVKNAIIVPTGAKGGFYIKNTAKNIRQIYSLFIGALLELTDNYIGGKIVQPKGGKIYDEADPYLVVAPDKGTADLSDLANSISAHNNFWMTDAFASSGSSGYSHKDMGITAKGAWEAVKRSFAELGVDANQDPIEVIGVGDMSGDVFGNGMLLSRNMKLICAFNHRNIFIDPSPDPEKSFKERVRLFNKPGSTWQDYNKAAMSANGAIFSRSAKSIKLSSAIRAKFDIKAAALSPDALIKHILQSPADLLWFGGIGTYIKGNDESHADVKDLPNDKIRVNGGDLNVKVIGEGANLGASLAGRIEFDRKGGRVATDSNDNSGGVHCSDKEVNIKIMLSVLQDQGKLQPKARDKLLISMTDDVSDGVLAENISQNIALSLDRHKAVELYSKHRRLALALDAMGDMGIEGMGGINAGAAAEDEGESFTRPQLANLFGALKNRIKEDLEKHPLPEDEFTLRLLQDYFPPQLSKLAGSSIREHFLAKQITSIQAINRIVDGLGLEFWSDVIESNTHDLPELVSLFLRLDETFLFTEVINHLAADPRHYPESMAQLLKIREVFIGMLEYLLSSNLSYQERIHALEVLSGYLNKNAGKGAGKAPSKTSAKTLKTSGKITSAHIDRLMAGDKYLLAGVLSMHSSLKQVPVAQRKEIVLGLIDGIKNKPSLK